MSPVSPEPSTHLPATQLLRAGPLLLRFEAGDLRRICCGGVEVLRRIYVAVRDRNWGTVPPMLYNLHLVDDGDNFTITYDVANRQGEIDFTWQAVITGSADGAITFRMDGVANTDFWRNRIGFSVLHPACAAGAACRVTHSDGSVQPARLPEWICPDQPVPPFSDMSALAHEAAPGLWLDLRFEGDLFEMEDQRNWTDASFKTFSTPLALPYPVMITAGTRVHQAVHINLRAEHPLEAVEVAQAAPVQFSAHWQSALPLPPVGLGGASHTVPLSPAQITRLQALHLDHLRVDVHLDQPDWQSMLLRVRAESQSLNLPLHLAVFISEKQSAMVCKLRAWLDSHQMPVAAWLNFAARELYSGGTPLAQAQALARQHLTTYALYAPIYSGTNTDFMYLQRNLPSLDQVDGLVFSINPQVHAFDDSSLMETLEAQGSVLASARRLAGGKPVIISPVTLKPRWNPYATAHAPELLPGGLPPQVDVRQASLLGAAWTLGSLKYLAEAGACGITYFETTGWRGVLETDDGSPVPAFPSQPGCAFPLYHVLADVAEFTGGDVIPLRSSANLRVDGMLLRQGERLRLLLANLTPEMQRVRLPVWARLMVRRVLDETNLEAAMNTPEQFRSQPAVPHSQGDEIELLPYAVSRLDG